MAKSTISWIYEVWTKKTRLLEKVVSLLGYKGGELFLFAPSQQPAYLH